MRNVELPRMRSSAALILLLVAACGRSTTAPAPAPVPDAAPAPTQAAPAPAAQAAPPVEQAIAEPTGAEPAQGAAGDDAGVAAGPTGVVRGTVKLAKGQKLPVAPPPQVNGQPAMAVAPCPAVDLHDQRTVVRAEAGGLSPVHLAITGMKATPPSTPRVHEVFIDGCRLRPILVGAMRGDTVRVTNRSDTALLPQLPGDRFMQGMMRGESREFVLKQLGRSVLRCNFANYCGETTLVTVSHPLFAVTDEQGGFRIENVPLDQPLKLHAFHPLFDVTTVELTLAADARDKEVELTLTPKPASALEPVKRDEAPPPSDRRDTRRPSRRAH